MEFNELPDFLLQPPEPNPVAVDWNGEDLHEGDKVFTIQNDLVHEDDLLQYVETFYGIAKSIEEL